MRRALASGLIPLFALLLVSLPGVSAQAAERRDAVVEVVEQVGPAVVFIGTEKRVERQFRGPAGRRHQRDGETLEGLGSGVIIDAKGTIVTNDHVIRGASAIHVRLADGTRLDAEVIGSDPLNDLAILRVSPAAPLPVARLGTSADLMIGEKAIAIGSPYGLEKTVTVGVVSGTGRSFRADNRSYNDFIQTDAAINPGNSGGPLLNVNGEIIGINTAIYASAQGIGFAIPADKVRRIVEELTAHGKVRPAWVGVHTVDLTPRRARELGWERRDGVLVARVEPGSPAAEAGLKAGDLVTQVGGMPVTGPEDFRVRLNGYPAEATLTFEILRDGVPLALKVQPVPFPPERAAALGWERLGVRVKAVRGGLLVTAIRPGSPAQEVGLEAGDGLLRLDTTRLLQEEDLRASLVAARNKASVLLVVSRGRSAYYLTLPF